MIRAGASWRCRHRPAAPRDEVVEGANAVEIRKTDLRDHAREMVARG